jgi:hypothetical protein
LIKNIEQQEGHMKNKNKFMGLIVAIVISFIADVSPCFGQPVPGGPGYFMQPASAFRPDSSSSNFTVSSNGASLKNSSPSTEPFYAPVSLPHGATINKFILYYIDNDAVSGIGGFLVRTPLPGNFAVPFAQVNSNSNVQSSAPDYIETTDINLPVVDNQKYAYFVLVNLPASANLSVNGFRIDYNFPTNLPLIMK